MKLMEYWSARWGQGSGWAGWIGRGRRRGRGGAGWWSLQGHWGGCMLDWRPPVEAGGWDTRRAGRGRALGPPGRSRARGAGARGARRGRGRGWGSRARWRGSRACPRCTPRSAAARPAAARGTPPPSRRRTRPCSPCARTGSRCSCPQQRRKICSSPENVKVEFDLFKN